MVNAKIISQTINEFEPKHRSIILQLTAKDIISTFNQTRDSFEQFRKNIIEQAKLTDVEKKIVWYFFAITLKQHLSIIVAAGIGDKVNMQLVGDAYRAVLHERTIIASKSFLKKIYIPQRIKWILASESFLKKMQEHTQKCFDERPNAKPALRHQYKTKWFYEKHMLSYIDKHQEVADEVLHIHRKEVLSKIIENPDHTEWDIVNFFVHEALHFSNPINHNKVSEMHIMATIAQAIHASHNERNNAQQTATHKKPRKTYKNNIAAIDEKSIQDVSISQQELRKTKFDQILSTFEKNIHEKTKKILKDIKSYIARCYIKNEYVRMQNIYQALWDHYNDEIVLLVRELCEKLDIRIQEIESAVKDIYKPIKPKTAKATWKKDTVTPTIVSKTLHGIKNTPEKLTTDLLITICKELGYRFWDEKEFWQYAAKLGLDKEGKIWLSIKKKLIDYFSKEQDKVRITDGNRNGSTYEKLTFSNYERMVKQKKTILWLVDHPTYDKLVDRHFWSNKDFDSLLDEQIVEK
jgi:uncharacterized protein (DUF2132 family)